ncbi:sensor histidine kinase [Sinorhizobium meliloti]|uniref:sensor histidine kinase n=1 Tax=Rhizobium meliloti TaxID=382 RepID=UPI003F173DAA
MVVIAEPDPRRELSGGHIADPSSGRSRTTRKFDRSGTVLVGALGSFWRAQTAGWLFGALFAVVSRILAFEDVAFAFALTAVLEPLGFALTTLAYRVFRHRIGGVTLTVVAVALALSIAGGLLQMLIANGIKDILQPNIDPDYGANGSVIPAIYYTLIFLGWSLAYLWIKADADARKQRIRRHRAREEALRAELHQLRLQLDSHFLFNVLNTVAMEIPEEPDTALEMIHRITAYLRYLLENQTRRICPLSDEIEAMLAYVRIQELRFEGRLDLVVEVDPAARSIAVPHLVLQPLVENAVKHGLRSSTSRFAVGITVERRDADLVIEISNPGRLEAGERDRPAIGLANIRRRLELHYPLGHALTLIQAGDNVIARLMLRGDACFA